MGFLNEQSLRMIVEAPWNTYDAESFSFPGISYLDNMNMPFTQSGPLRKMVIAARFNISVPDGWPELQIIRTANGGIPYIVFTTNTMEPKPTGYLNLYEYNLTAINFNIQAGDKLSISWHGVHNNTQQPRFSLAYYHNGTSPAIPMVSIVVGDCDSKTDLLILNTLYCEPITDSITNNTSTPATTGSVTSTGFYTFEVVTNARTGSTETMTEESISTQASTNQTELSTSNDKPIIIGGTVVFSLLLLLIPLISFFVSTFVVKRRRKSTSMNVTDPIEMSTQPRMLHNPPSESVVNSNQASTTQEVKHDEAVDCIEMDANQAYITHSETKGAGKKECIKTDANQAYGTDTLPTDPNVAYNTVDSLEMDANQAYATNTVPTNPNVAYGIHPPQIHDYEYVTLL